MRITIRSYSIFSDFLGNEVRIELDESITVGELLDYLKNTYSLPSKPEPIVLINGEIASMDQQLRDGDTVYIAPPFSGG
ncbi:MAG: MoaD/ThiS family protein [Desulfurococcus sp.]|jgi:molybdopterin synthase sulfur carrier subunit|uniref:MoaD/ThiS family protein n=1 Tax=Desulfurococcus sp. TaxID=51678 RepID=UPI0031670217